MEELQSLFNSRDVTGARTRRAWQALTRAHGLLCASDAVREFVLGPPDPDADLALLTSPMHIAAATTFSGAALSSGGHSFDGLATSGCLLVPAATISGVAVGIVIEREHRQAIGPSACNSMQVLLSRHDSVQVCARAEGRFAFRPQTGELLVYTRLLVGEKDMPFSALATMAMTFGGVEPPSEATLARTRCRLLWWESISGVQGDLIAMAGAKQARLNAVVDDEFFRMGFLQESVIASSFSGNCRREACSECARREATVRTMLEPCVDLTMKDVNCRCHDVLAPTPTLVDLSGATRNMRALRGFWTGFGETITVLPGIAGPAVTCTQNIDMNIEFGRDTSLISELQAMAIGSALAARNVDRATSHLLMNGTLHDPPQYGDHELSVLDGSQPVNGAAADVIDRILEDPEESDAVHFTQAFSAPETALAHASFTLWASLMAPTHSRLTNPTVSNDPSPERMPNSAPNVSEGGDSALNGATSTPREKRARSSFRKLSPESRERALEERRQRNRECAARSNLARRLRNEELKESLRQARQQAVLLGELEQALRKENIELRRVLEQSRKLNVFGP